MVGWTVIAWLAIFVVLAGWGVFLFAPRPEQRRVAAPTETAIEMHQRWYVEDKIDLDELERAIERDLSGLPQPTPWAEAGYVMPVVPLKRTGRAALTHYEAQMQRYYHRPVGKGVDPQSLVNALRAVHYQGLAGDAIRKRTEEVGGDPAEPV